MSHLTKTRAYLLLLVTLTTIGISYATQDPNVITYLNSLRTNDSGLPNVPNQKGSFGYILAEIFNTSGKIKQDYLDLTGLGGAGGSVASVNTRTGAVSLTSTDVGLSNVEDTKLSTWAGSSNITTLGTIASGIVPWARLSGVPTTVGGYGITDAIGTNRTLSTTAPLSGGGDLSVNRTLSIAQATTSTNGYLSSTDWNTFNNKAPINSPALTGTPTRTTAPVDGDNSTQLATTAWVKANTVSAAGGAGLQCYYSDAGCPLGTNQMPGMYYGGGASNVAHSICCMDKIPVFDCINYDVPTGTRCSDTTIFAGKLNGFKYQTTPGGCVDGTNPLCGGNDTLTKAWNYGNGNYTTTSKTSTTDGFGNTLALATTLDADASVGGIQPHLAAKYCQDMVYGGYSDWFLPAQNELNMLYEGKTSIGGFGSNIYWSSTEYDKYNAWYQIFNIGTQNTISKDSPSFVRCIRKF